MKTSLIILTLALIAGSVFAAEKKTDMRQGTKAVDEKYLEDMTSTIPERKILPQDVHATQDRNQQMESKKSRQYQEELPVTDPYYNKENE